MITNYCVKVRFAIVFFTFLTCGIESCPSNELESKLPKLRFFYTLLHHVPRVNASNANKGINFVIKPIRIGKEFTLGKRVPGDSQAYQFDYLKPQTMYRPIAKIKATFPREPYSYNSKNCPITMIHIGCPTGTTCYFEDDYVSMIGGGIGKPHVMLRITSTNHHIYKYKLSIYTKC